MAHKVHPIVFRLGTVTTWPSRWFARSGSYRQNLEQDLELRSFLAKELKEAAVNRIDIERSRAAVTVQIWSAKPGIVIGRSGDGIDALRAKILKKFFPGKTKTTQLHIAVHEVSKPSLEAALVAQGIVLDLERRMAFRRVMKMTLERVKKAGALGAKVCLSGRLNGAEIARTEKLSWGKIPLTNLRADIDYHQTFARTMAGAIGVKVWIYRGDIFAQDRLSAYQPTTPSRGGRDGERRGGGRFGQDRRGGGRGYTPRPAAPAAEGAVAPVNS